MPSLATPRDLVARYHAAMLAKDARALADLYAVDGIHDFPLFSPFFPQRLTGREAIAKHYGALWGASPIRIVEIRQVAFHETADPAVIVSEAEFTAEGGPKSFNLSFAIVMQVANGEIVHLRDYMDALGAAWNLGRLDVLVQALERRQG
jgi:uncharacterized protein